MAYVNRDECYRFASAKYRDWLGIDHTATIGRHVRDAVSEEY